MHGSKLKQSKDNGSWSSNTFMGVEPQSGGLRAALLFDPKSVAALQLEKVTETSSDRDNTAWCVMDTSWHQCFKILEPTHTSTFIQALECFTYSDTARCDTGYNCTETYGQMGFQIREKCQAVLWDSCRRKSCFIPCATANACHVTSSTPKAAFAAIGNAEITRTGRPDKCCGSGWTVLWGLHKTTTLPDLLFFIYFLFPFLVWENY